MAITKIMVVEDENIVALDIKNRLKNIGYAVPVVVSSGKEAVKKAEEIHPDLVLMDIHLGGGMDGVETAGELRERFDIPIVYLTAYSDDETLKRAKITEPFGYILKPFDERELHSTIETALYKHSMEQKLKESEQWLSTTLKSIGDAVTASDTKGRVTFMNPIAQTLTCWKEEDAVGRPLKEVFKIINEETGKEVRNPVGKVLKEGISLELSNHILIAGDGKKIPIDDSASPIIDDKGNITGVVLVFRDVTERKRVEDALKKSRDELEMRVEERTKDLISEIEERKRMEEALRLSEIKFREVAQSASDAIISADSSGKIIFWNKAAQAIFGYTAEEMSGMQVSLLMPERYREAYKKGLKRLNSGRKSHVIGRTIDLNGLRKDGIEFPLELSLATWNIGKKTFYSSIIRDITRRKQIEEKLRESEERFRQIFEQDDDAVMMFDPETSEIIDINTAAVDLYGYTKDELLKDGPALFFEPCEHRKFKQTICKEKGFHLNKQTNIKKDGRKIIVSIEGKSIKLKKSDVVYCSFHDITENIRMEEEAKLLQAKLVHANKMTSLGLLVSSVAHEINNPNNFIMLNTSLLSDAWQDANRVLKEHFCQNGEFSLGGLPYSEMSGIIPKLLSGISDGSGRIKNIIDNLKDFARNEKAGKVSIVNINKVIMTSVSIINNQIKKHTDHFHCNCAKKLPVVKGSSLQLEQVVINLIMNSLQALPEKRCGVWLSTSFSKKAGCIIINIKDEGTGMTEDVLNQITEPFFTTKLDTGGTGLGLSISNSIIKEHKGSLKFESKPDRGTTAIVKLPIHNLDH